MLSEKHASMDVDRVDVAGDIQCGAITLRSSERTFSARLTPAQFGGLARQLWTLLSRSIAPTGKTRHPDAPVPVDDVNMVVGKSGTLVVLEFRVGDLRLPLVLSAEVIRQMGDNLPAPSNRARYH
jgi:hypothetical protein